MFQNEGNVNKFFYSPSGITGSSSPSVEGRVKAGIVGGAGYTGGELIRILLNHPEVEITFVNSKSNAGKQVSSVHADLIGDTDMTFAADLSNQIDVLFLCVGHG